MNFACRWWLAIGVAVLLAPVAVMAQERGIFEIGGGGAFKGTHQTAVSHGHAYLVPGHPGFVFGGVQQPDGQWRLNYLFLIKHAATATSAYQRGDPDPATSSNSSDGKIRTFHFREQITFDGVRLSLAYKAEWDAVNDRLLTEAMTVDGKPRPLADGRVFVVDLTAEPIAVQQVDVKLPSSQDIDFLNSTSDDYRIFTRRWLAEIAEDSEVVAALFKE